MEVLALFFHRLRRVMGESATTSSRKSSGSGNSAAHLLCSTATAVIKTCSCSCRCRYSWMATRVPGLAYLCERYSLLSTRPIHLPYPLSFLDCFHFHSLPFVPSIDHRRNHALPAWRSQDDKRWDLCRCMPKHSP